MKEFLHAITHFNPKIMESIVQGIPIFIIEKMVAEMLNLLEVGIIKLLTKPTKEKEREKEAAIYGKNVPLEALVD